MEEDKVIKWYQNKYNLTVTAFVLVVFGIATTGFNVHQILYHTSYGESLRNKYGIIFEWAIWIVSLAALIDGILLKLEDYWKWVSVLTIGVIIFQGIATARTSFSIEMSFSLVFGSIVSWATIGTPFIIFISVMIFGIKKLIISIKEQWKDESSKK